MNFLEACRAPQSSWWGREERRYCTFRASPSTSWDTCHDPEGCPGYGNGSKRCWGNYLPKQPWRSPGKRCVYRTLSFTIGSVCDVHLLEEKIQFFQGAKALFCCSLPLEYNATAPTKYWGAVHSLFKVSNLVFSLKLTSSAETLSRTRKNS